MQRFVARDGFGVGRRGFLADREADASRAEGDRLALRARAGNDGHLHAVPWPLGRAELEGGGQQRRRLGEGVEDGIPYARRETAIACDGPHRRPVVEPDHQEAPAAQAGICGCPEKFCCALPHSHVEFSGSPDRMS